MPNVIVLMSDEHNPMVSSVYGHEFVDTPNMQRLASEGSTYTAYTSSPLCLPARSSFLCGLPVFKNQSYSNCNMFLPQFRTYAQDLADNGVYTCFSGKLDTYIYEIEDAGFSKVLRLQDRNKPGDKNIGRSPLKIREGSAARANGYGPEEKPSGDRETVDLALEWLRTKAGKLDKPFVLFVGITNPHFPHIAPQVYWDKYADHEDLPEFGPECVSANHPYARDLRDHFETDHFSEEQIRGLRRGYYGCVNHVDQMLGELMDAVEECGLKNDTDIIYTSDHGEMLGKFGMWWKCSLYEDSVRIPMIAAGPDFPRNRRYETPVELLDIHAFLYSIYNIERPGECRGIPLNELPEASGERIVFSEYHGHGTRGSAFLIRRGDWKLIYYTQAPNQLFNLELDPDELRDVSADHPDIMAELITELQKVCNPEEVDTEVQDLIDSQLHAISELDQ